MRRLETRQLFRASQCRKDPLHLQKSIPSPGFENSAQHEGILKSLSLSSLLNYLRAFGDGPVAGVPGGQGIESWLSCLEFEPSATKDPPCRAAMQPDGHGYELVSSVRALVPQKFCVEEELMHVKHVEVKSPHIGGMWKFEKGVIISGIVLVT
ncbi:hypothetical protein TNCV_1684841 [Trichonephila clavipes]|nr:hypothetical protein TNCV_1684841 [Trichonephila clavipes]